MSGRGRGRGRGRGAPPTGAKLLLMRSAQESGLDDRNLKNLQDITRPSLFPDIAWQEDSNKTRQASTIHLINKGREMVHRMQNSAHHVRPRQSATDVERYNNKRPFLASASPDVAVMEQIGKRLIMDEAYTPPELLPSKKTRTLSLLWGKGEGEGANKTKPALDELEKKELEKRREELRQANNLEEEGEGGEDDDEVVVEEEAEDIEDYTTNYYESEDESAGDADNEEPTF